MVSSHLLGGFPKYVWAVDDFGEVFEAKLGEDGRSYHGYPIGDEDRDLRWLIQKEWRTRQ